MPGNPAAFSPSLLRTPPILPNNRLASGWSVAFSPALVMPSGGDSRTAGIPGTFPYVGPWTGSAAGLAAGVGAGWACTVATAASVRTMAA